jgi:probable phosphoglycerate mutase
MAFSRVLTSPLQRARETCRLEGLLERAEIEPDLGKGDYGACEGMTSAEIQRLAPDWIVLRDGCPEGESPAQVGALRVLVARCLGPAGPATLERPSRTGLRASARGSASGFVATEQHEEHHH